jgi:hypothetical protein
VIKGAAVLCVLWFAAYGVLLIISGTPVACAAADSARRGWQSPVALALRAGLSPSATCGRQRTSLLLSATWSENEKLVAYLLAKGADPNSATEPGYTPVMAASRLNDPAIFRLLLAKGAHVQPAESGQWFLSALAHNGETIALRRLLQAGLDPRPHCRDLIREASNEDHVDILRMVLDSGCDTNPRGTAAGTPQTTLAANTTPPN